MKERPPVPAKVHFQERAAEFRDLPLEQVFQLIHDTNLWGAEESLSGPGSERSATTRLQAELPALLRDLGAKTLLDIPCGDFAWMSHVDMPGTRYIGADIVDSLIEKNRLKYGREFIKLDLCADNLPRADVVFCRDCLVHLSFANIHRAAENLKRSGSTWLLTTTFLECDQNTDIADGDWRMLNFDLMPFAWGSPAHVLLEGCIEADGGYADKALGLWPISAIR